MQELISYINRLEVTMGRSSYEIKLILDYADKMLEKELILEKTLVKHAIMETLETADDLMNISLRTYMETIFNLIDYRSKSSFDKNPESFGGEAPIETA